jgi:hypothetical protein
LLPNILFHLGSSGKQPAFQSSIIQLNVAPQTQSWRILMIEKQFIFPTQVFRAVYNNSQELQKSVVTELLAKEKTDTSPVRYTAI